jgi:hypothetical protein
LHNRVSALDSNADSVATVATMLTRIKMGEPEYYQGSLTWLADSSLTLTNKYSRKHWGARTYAVRQKLNLQERLGDLFNVRKHTNEIPGSQDGCCLGFQQPWLLL